METVGPTPDPTDKATCDHLQHSTANLAVLYSVHTLSTILCIVRKSLAGEVSYIYQQQQQKCMCKSNSTDFLTRSRQYRRVWATTWVTAGDSGAMLSVSTQPWPTITHVYKQLCALWTHDFLFLYSTFDCSFWDKLILNVLYTQVSNIYHDLDWPSRYPSKHLTGSDHHASPYIW